VVRSRSFRETDFVKRNRVALIAIVLFAHDVGRASPPEYLAASREPAETASEQASPIEEPVLELRGWRLAQHSTEPFFRDSIFSLQPRFYYRYLDDGKGLSEAFAGGGALLLTSGWWRDTLQLGLGGYTTQPLATGRDPGARVSCDPMVMGFPYSVRFGENCA
jgi:hypothetical protein